MTGPEHDSLPNSHPVADMEALSLRENIPLHVHFEMTYNCNFHCVHCYRCPRDARELDTAETLELIERLAGMGALFLMLTGGEPLSRPDFFEIAVAARRLGFALRLLTNGSFIDDEAADRIADLKFQEVGVSLYGATAATHEAVTGVTGSFEKTMRGLERLAARGVTMHMKYPMMKRNRHEARAALRIAENLGVWCMIDVSLTPRDDGALDPIAHRLEDRDLVEAVADPQLFAKAHAPHAETRLGRLGCDAGRNLIGVSPYGDVWPCVQWKEIAGNLRDRPIEEIWRDSEVFHRLRTMRDEDAAECFQCEDRPHCARCAGVARLEDGDPLAPSSRACRVARILRDLRNGVAPT